MLDLTDAREEELKNHSLQDLASDLLQIATTTSFSLHRKSGNKSI